MQLTCYIVCMYEPNHRLPSFTCDTSFSSLFTKGLGCIPRSSSQYFLNTMHNYAIKYVAIASKQPKNCALRAHTLSFHKLYVYIATVGPPLSEHQGTKSS